MSDTDLVEHVKGAAYCVFGGCHSLAHVTIRRWRRTWGPYCSYHDTTITRRMDAHGRSMLPDQETTT